MDATPSTPPSITQSTEQAAVDAYRRIEETGLWLSEQQQALPALRDIPDHTDRETYLTALHAYWDETIDRAPGRKSPRNTALADKLATVMTGVAVLRHQDGSLDDAALDLIRAFTVTDTIPPPHIQVHDVRFGDAVHAGMLIAFDDRHPDLVVVFSADRGWDRFDSIDKAYDFIDRWARRTLAWRDDLPGLAKKDIDTLSDLPAVGSRPVTGSPLEAMVGRFIGMQREKLQQAWLEYAFERSVQGRDLRLKERVADATRLHDLFDTSAILIVREALLLQHMAQDRLDRLPADDVAAFRDVNGVRSAWLKAADEYAATLRAVVAQRSALVNDPLPPLHQYAADMLGSILGTMGIDEDPRDIQLTLDRTSDPTARLDSLQALLEGPPALHTNLLDLAYANAEPPGLGRFTARDRHGQLLTALDDATLRGIVRTLDLHTRYPDLVESARRHGETGTAYTDTVIDLQLARMRLDAVDARITGFLEQSDKGRYHGLSQRGWLWTQAVLDSPAALHRRQVHHMDVAARQVTYHGVPVRDIVEIGWKQIPPFHPVELMSSLVYYTPDAPDGVVFREFANAEEAQRLFFRHPAFAGYLLERLPLEFSEVPENGHVRRFKSNRRTDWVFGSGEPDGYTPMEFPFISRDIQTDILEANHDVAIDLVQRDARLLTTSTREADTRRMIDLLHRRPAEQLIGRVVMGAVTAPFHVAPAAWHAYDHVREGNYVDALADIAGAYASALGAASPPATLLAAAPRSVGTAFFRAAGGHGLTTHVVGAVPARRASVPVKAIQHPQGVYAIDGRTAMAIEGRLYTAHYDKAQGTVSADMSQPLDMRSVTAVHRFHHARWQAQRAGGPAAEPVASTEIATSVGGRRDVNLYQEYLAQIEREFPDLVERQMVNHQMSRELVGLPPLRRISTEQRIRVERAWATAEQTLRTSLAERPFIHGRFRRVPDDALPEKVWFYGEHPVYRSPFVRTASRRQDIGRNAWGAFIGESQGHGVVGIRVTTVPPQAADAAISAGSALRRFDRPSAFAVEVNVRDVLGQQATPRGGMQLLEVVGNAHQYILRPRTGGLFEMRRGQFTLVDRLPDPALPAALP